MNDYWQNYTKSQPTTNAANIVMGAEVTAYVAMHAIPRFVNREGDVQLYANWHLNDRFVNKDLNAKSYDNTEAMQQRNWTTPF